MAPQRTAFWPAQGVTHYVVELDLLVAERTHRMRIDLRTTVDAELDIRGSCMRNLASLFGDTPVEILSARNIREVEYEETHQSILG